MKKRKAPPQSKGWISTDLEEIERRRFRGQSEKMKVQSIDQELPFSIYTVSTKTSTYKVELRSFHLLCNSCNCPDFQNNELGTCKHIEGVIYRAKGKRKISPFAEVYLSLTDGPKVCILWPENSPILSRLQKVLSPYFSSNDTLLSEDLIAGVDAVQNAVKHAESSVRKHIRISAHLLNWVENQRQKIALHLSKEQFLADVKAGKRTLQMLSTPLYPYQEEGMLHLAFQGRALLSDEMGLGKTIQAIAAAELLRRLHHIQRVLIVCPTSIKGEWEEQITKFTSLSKQVIYGERSKRLLNYRSPSFFNIANYEQVRNDAEDIQRILAPDLIILDEAQRIKNWNTQTAIAVKKLQTPFAFVLTGTPLENRIDDIYSIMQFVNPQIFGPLFKFNRQFYKLDEKGKATGYKNLEKFHKCLQPVLLRRLKRDVEEQLPERTINHYFVQMTAEQQKRYESYSDRVARLLHTLKRRPFTEDEFKRLQQYLACMRMTADTPFILDAECRDCPKLNEIEEILDELLQNPDCKVILFSEWERMLILVKEFLASKEIDFAWHTGSVNQKKRREEIKRFKEDPNCRCFLSTDAGSTGLNLQVANTVINIDLPWNPARLEQRIARAWRKHQTRPVQVINLVCKNSIEYRMLATLAQKQQLSESILDGEIESDEMDLVSGRAALLERLEGLLEQSPSKIVPVTEDSLTIVKNNFLARFTDRIQQLQFYEKPHPTLIAVMDECTAETKLQMHEIINQNFDKSPPDLVLIDNATFKMLQKLSENEVLHFKGDMCQTLYQSPHYGEKQILKKQKQLEDAKHYFSLAERQMSMSSLLASGQFFLEALPPAAEALTLGIQSLTAMEIAPSSGWIHLQSQITQTQTIETVLPTLQSVKEVLEEISQTLIQFSLK